MKAVVALVVVLGAFLAGLAIAVNAPPYVADPVRVMLGLAFAGAFALVLRGPFGQALAEQLRDGPGPSLEGPLLSQLEEVIAELRGMREDMLQIHERIDFTERIMSQQREERRIGTGLREES